MLKPNLTAKDFRNVSLSDVEPFVERIPAGQDRTVLFPSYEIAQKNKAFYMPRTVQEGRAFQFKQLAASAGRA
jgi:hypothetical protein